MESFTQTYDLMIFRKKKEKSMAEIESSKKKKRRGDERLSLAMVLSIRAQISSLPFAYFSVLFTLSPPLSDQ